MQHQEDHRDMGECCPGDELTDEQRLARAMQADVDDVSMEELEAASDLLDRLLAES